MPGDVVTCTACGAEGRAWTTAPSRWAEGDALLITWTNGPDPRHTSTVDPPDLCLWCDDRRLGFPTLLGRPLPGEAPWSAGGPRCTFEIPAVGLRSAGEGPLNAGATGKRLAPAVSTDGNKAPLERFAELADAFYRETGMVAPGAPALGGAASLFSEAEVAARWRSWCAARAAAARPPKSPPPPPPPPRGQLSLL